MDKEQIKKDLQNIFGERTFFDEKTLTEYSFDMTEIKPSLPDFVIKAQSNTEIQKLLNLANLKKIPIIPCVARTNLGGLSLPEKGGIILDLTLMNKIIEVREKEMYALIEPGVTFAQIKEYLEENYPQLRFGYPLSPPHTSILANCILDGLANFSLVHGCTSNWIQGMEVILPTGEITKIGSCAASPFWFSRAPLPDLAGLFISWQGTTGIVTKLSVSLFPSPPYRYRAFLMCYDFKTAFNLMQKYSRLNICDDIGGLSWPTGKMLFGVEKPLYKDKNEPEFYVYIDISANTKRELAAKVSQINKEISHLEKNNIAVEGPLPVEEIVKIDESFNKFAEFPTYLDFLLDNPGGGLTWIGTYGPISNWEKGARKCADLMLQRGFSPTIVSRPMKGSHFVILRLITIFNKNDRKEVIKVKKLQQDICDLVLNLGFIPYKTPVWIIEKLLKENKIDKNYYTLAKKIKNVLDPNHIMNPGKWKL